MSTPAGQLPDKLRLAASKGQTAKIKELVELGATFDPDKAGRSPLHLAVTDGHVEAIKSLVEEGCPVDRQDQVNGNSALHEAAWNGYSKSVEVLVTYGRANLHVANRNGMRPLHMSVQNGHNESTRVLLRNGAHPDARNNVGESPLHVASTHGHVTCCRILISGNSDINAINKDGNTPLHVAASLGKRKITKILVEAGCDIGIKNNKGQTAIDVAREHEYPEVIIIMTSAPRGQAKSRRHHHHRNQSEYHQDTSAVMGRREQRGTGQGMMGAQTISAGHYPDHLHHHHHHANPMPHHGNPMSHDETDAHRHRPPHRSSPRQSQSQKKHVHGLSVTDEPRSGFGPPWYQQSGKTWQQQVWDQWSWQRQQEQHYESLQGQRQAPLERVIDEERHHHQDVQLGRIMGNPHDHEYYRDQMGNVRERDINNCNCMPYIRRLENQLEATKEKFMYEIESTSQMMEDKMKHFDKKMAHQSSCLDQLCKERITAERTECLHRIDRRAQKEQAEFERRSTVRINALRRELKNWFEDRFKHFERKYGDDYIIHDDGTIKDRTSDPGQDDDDDEYDEPGASLLRSKSEGRLPSNYHSSEHKQNDTEDSDDVTPPPSSSSQSGVKATDPITATRTLQEVRYAKTKPIENAAADPLLLEEESETTATEKDQDSVDGRPAKPPKPPKPPKPAKPPPPPRTVSYPSNPISGAIPKRTVLQHWEQKTRMNMNESNVQGTSPGSSSQSSPFLAQNRIHAAQNRMHTTSLQQTGRQRHHSGHVEDNSNYSERTPDNDTTNQSQNSTLDVTPSSPGTQLTPNHSFLHGSGVKTGVKTQGYIRQNPTQSGGQEYIRPHPVQSGGQEYSRPNPTQSGGTEYFRPNPAQTGGTEYSRPNPTQSGGQEYLRQNPTQSGGQEYSRPNPVQSGGQEYSRPNPTQSGRQEYLRQNPTQSGGQEYVRPNPTQSGGQGYIRPNPAQSGGMARFYVHSQRTQPPSYSSIRTQSSTQNAQSIGVSPLSVNTSLANASIPAKESPSTTLTSSPDSTSTPRTHDSNAMNNNRDSDSTSTSSRSRRDPIDPSLALALLEENNNPTKPSSSTPESLRSEGNDAPSPVPYGQQTRRSMYSPLDQRNLPISTVEVRPAPQVARDNYYNVTASGKPHPDVESHRDPSKAKNQVPLRQNGGPHYAVL